MRSPKRCQKWAVQTESRFAGLVWLVAIVVFAGGWPALGDDPIPSTGIGAFVPAALTPGAPDGVYPLSDIDHINLSNLHLSVFIPVAPAMGRGQAKIPVGVSVDKGQVAFPSSQTSSNCPNYPTCTLTYTYSVGYAWDIPLPTFTGAGLYLRQWGSGCVVTPGTSQGTTYYWTAGISTLVFVKPDGTQTELLDHTYGGEPLSGVSGLTSRPPDRGRVFWTHDGSAAVLTLSAGSLDVFDPLECGGTPIPMPISGTLLMRDGTEWTCPRF